jgi:hypothetical protein
MSLDLDNLLASMEREGRLESSGAFTIDLAAAQKKLALYTLPDSRGYILKMVQAAVAGRARELHVDSRERLVEVRILGLELEQEGLEMLLYRLAESGKTLPRSSYHLAVGIRAALGLESDEITIRSCNGQQEKRIVWARDSIRHEIVESSEPAQTVVLFTRTRRRFWRELMTTLNSRDLLGMLRGEPSGYNEEHKLVNDIACLAPLTIVVNGSRVDGLPSLPEPPSLVTARKTQSSFIQEVFYPVQQQGERGFRTPLNCSHPKVIWPKSGSGSRHWSQLECCQIIGLHPSVPETQLVVILDGVLIHRRSQPGLATPP